MSNPSTNPGAPYPDMNNAHLQVLALANELGRRAKNQMILGASLAVGGIVLTLVTYRGRQAGRSVRNLLGLDPGGSDPVRNCRESPFHRQE